MNKLPKIFLTIVALFVITDTYAGVTDGLYKRMNPDDEPHVQKPTVKPKSIPRKPNHYKTYHHVDHSPPLPITNPEPPLPPLNPDVYTINRLKNIWLKEEHPDQINLYVHINQTNVDSLLKSFVDGTIELGQPSVGYKDYRPKFWEFYGVKDWESLAKAIIEGGSNQDIDWFYLGRSAEGLKLYKAAYSYYTKGLSATSKCNKIPSSTSNDGCDGFNFPQDIEDQRKNVIFTFPPSP